jgi:hypothetical protein
MASDQGPRGMRGIPGPPGPPGAIGKVGATGARGKTGRAGERGAQGARGKSGLTAIEGPAMTRSARLELLSGVEGQIEEIRRDLVVQIKRMEQLQVQVDEVRAAIRELTTEADGA